MGVFKERPLNNIILRRFEKPGNNSEENLRKFCISIGLLQPGDSRDVIVDVLKIFLNARNEKRLLSIDEIKIGKRGSSTPNIRRQVRRLIESGIVERVSGKYRIREFMNLSEIIDDIIKYQIEPTLKRIKEYAEKIDSEFTK